MNEEEIYQQELARLKRQKNLAIAKTVFYPVILISAFFVAIIFGAVVGIANESLKKILK